MHFGVVIHHLRCLLQSPIRPLNLIATGLHDACLEFDIIGNQQQVRKYGVETTPGLILSNYRISSNDNDSQPMADRPRGQSKLLFGLDGMNPPRHMQGYHSSLRSLHPTSRRYPSSEAPKGQERRAQPRPQQCCPGGPCTQTPGSSSSGPPRHRDVGSRTRTQHRR